MVFLIKSVLFSFLVILQNEEWRTDCLCLHFKIQPWSIRILSTKKPISMTENRLERLNRPELLSHLPTQHNLHWHVFFNEAPAKLFFIFNIFFFHLPLSFITPLLIMHTAAL